MTTPYTIQPGQSIQRMQTEWSDEFMDQFGRKFAANYDIRNMRPKEELRPVGFSPPWQPPMGYIKWDRQGGFTFRWDLETMANDLSENATAYYAQVFEFMAEHMAGHEPPDIGEPVPTKVIRSPVGKPPLSPAIPLACLAGDPWILGTPGATPNKLLKDILDQSATANGRQALAEIRARMAKMVEQGGQVIPTRVVQTDADKAVKARSIVDIDPANLPLLTYKEFLSACMAQGKTMAEGALAWQRHKDDLAMSKAS